MRRWIPIVATLVLCGAGCKLDQKLDWHLPISLNPASEVGDSAAASKSVKLQSGLAFTVRPSTLGVSGTVDQVFGLDQDAVNVTVKEAGTDRRTIAWNDASASGTLTVSPYADAETMILPAFWQTGAITASHNGGLWLSRSAYDALSAGKEVEWRIGVADDALGTLSTALKTFNSLSAQFFGSATAGPELSPFTIKKTGTAEAFPLMLDGQLTLLRTLEASSWFADFVILDNPDDPLILKVSVHPAAAPALKALQSEHLRSDELGYEITSLERP